MKKPILKRVVLNETETSHGKLYFRFSEHYAVEADFPFDLTAGNVANHLRNIADRIDADMARRKQKRQYKLRGIVEDENSRKRSITENKK